SEPGTSGFDRRLSKDAAAELPASSFVEQRGCRRAPPLAIHPRAVHPNPAPAPAPAPENDRVKLRIWRIRAAHVQTKGPNEIPSTPDLSTSAASASCLDSPRRRRVTAATRLHASISLLPAVDIDGAAPPAATARLSSSHFFCLEDRALLCRPCDVAVHTAGAHVASHRRFIIIGVRVGGGVACHHVPGSGGVGGGVSPNTSSDNGSSSAPRQQLRQLNDHARQRAAAIVAVRRSGGKRGPWRSVTVEPVPGR
ncbi:uncharacterized protein LOC111256721, partial [Setaria italica]|uniref:uncharacterized protein LOC111256721 n=1 Tax=Setaria italica TaxID=4555 RepID=UPI000BE537D1